MSYSVFNLQLEQTTFDHLANNPCAAKTVYIRFQANNIIFY